MPRSRESLKSAKARLVREQQTRTDRRIQALLQPRLTGEDAEIFDDSEEENRLSGRGVRAKRDKATQTDLSSSSFCCGVLLGVCVVVFLVFSHLPSDKWQAKECRVKVTSQVDAAPDKEEDSVQGHSNPPGQSQKTKGTKKTAIFRR